MILVRLDSNPNPKPDHHRQAEFGIENIEDNDPQDSRVKVAFSAFWSQEKNRSDFVVELNWIDVQGYIRSFVEMGHPDALYLQPLIRLAGKIENAGWFPE
jgi:hypothetical protein